MNDSEITNQQSEETKKEKTILVIFRFVLVPLLLVGVIVFIVILFGQMALKQKTVKDYVYDMKTGSKSERWQAAYHLSNLLATQKEENIEEARKHLPDLILIFERSAGSDHEIRRYLALAMGRLKDERAAPVLVGSLEDPDSQTVLWSIWALGAIGSRESTPEVVEKLESSDDAVRIMSAYVLGALLDPRAVPPLQAHLQDSSPEVRWNSAIALARMNDASGVDILSQMLTRSYLESFPSLAEDRKEELMINAIRASTRLQSAELQSQVREVSKSDPNPRVRDAALKALVSH